MLKWDRNNSRWIMSWEHEKKPSKIRRYERTSSKVKTASRVWKSIEKFRYFQFLENFFSLIEKKPQILWRKFPKLAASPQSRKNKQFNQIQKLGNAKKCSNGALKNWKRIVENRNNRWKMKKNSNSDNRLWCSRKSSKIILTYFWNAI